MRWNQLLSTDRLGGKIDIRYDAAQLQLNEFEVDYWRILECSAFRRLQDKTQVFPLDRGDFVRTRLTHSLEVAALAKQLVMMAYNRIETRCTVEVREAYPFTAEEARLAADAVACAGLLHDIGNPPFGHFGETVVHAWFENHLEGLCYRDREQQRTVSLETDVLLSDLKHFEGNAQAFRLVTKLHDVDSPFGLDLTAAVLNTLVKYPTDSLHIDPNSPNVCLHKLGFYHADRELFQQVARWTGTQAEEGEGCRRHPLTFLLEAADDIAYATADLEDSYKKGLFTLEEFQMYFEEQCRSIPDNNQRFRSDELLKKFEACRDEEDGSPAGKLRAFQKWIHYTRYWLLYCAAFGFQKNYPAIMEGAYHQELLCGTYHEGTIGILKGATVRFTFNTAEIIKLELAAETILEGLLDRFVPAAIDWEAPSESRMAKRKAERKLMTLVSENQKNPYKQYRGEDPEYNLYLRLLLIADFVSGMTDTYAKTLYQELGGI